ncbi:MAG: hypothetical protein ACLFRH_07245 [Halothiobacillaceae bacterium]
MGHAGRFARYIGIDYSGAGTADCGLPGLRVYLATVDSPAREILPPPGRSRYWSRRGLAHWLVECLKAGLDEAQPTVVGIDHGFSFPLDYFAARGLADSWPAFLADFHAHWPTDREKVRVDDVRAGRVGEGAVLRGSARWRRLTEQRAGAKSVFHFDVPGSVAKSTHAGLPWLRFLRTRLGPGLHVWPFDGWTVPAGRSLLLEVYPALWSGDYPRADRTPDQHDAWVVAAALRSADGNGRLAQWLAPPVDDSLRVTAEREGWIAGVG